MAVCMGGCMALQALAAQPDLPIGALVALATPIDFRHLGPMVDAVREGRIDPQSVIDDTGNLPGSVVRRTFNARRPTSNLVQYANLWQHLWDDDYMEGFQAIGRWLHDQIPIPGALFEQVVQQWLKENAFFTDRLRLGGRRAPLGAVRTPVLGVLAIHDDVTSEPSTAPIVDVLTGTDAQLMRVDAGHASLFSGRKAVKSVMPQIFDWLESHSRRTA
jgi:polyhydroxyalkanoate synthase